MGVRSGNLNLVVQIKFKTVQVENKGKLASLILSTQHDGIRIHDLLVVSRLTNPLDRGDVGFYISLLLSTFVL